MGIRSGTLSARPLMELTFEVLVARLTVAHSALSIDTVQTWTMLPRRVRCDIMPLNDYEYFTQSGDQNISTHVIHFYAQEDIRDNDRVQFAHSQRLAGPVGSWYEIQRVLSPTESIAFTRAYCASIDAPALPIEIGIKNLNATEPQIVQSESPHLVGIYRPIVADTTAPDTESPALTAGLHTTATDTTTPDSESAALGGTHLASATETLTPDMEAPALTGTHRPTASDTTAPDTEDAALTGIHRPAATDTTSPDTESAALPASHVPSASDTITPASETPILVEIFNPSTITGMKAWLDAADTPTITLVSSAASQWNDKSGNGNNVTQGTGANRPTQSTLNGLNVLVFSGSSQTMSIAGGTGIPVGGTAFSWFAVALANNTTASPTIILLGSSANYSALYLPSGQGYAWATPGTSRADSAAIGTAAHVVSGVTSGGAVSNYSQWLDGNLETLASVGGGTTPTSSGTLLQVGALGSGQFLNGRIAEVIIYTGALSTGDRQSVEGYLAWKWGLQANLPGGHPYKSVKP